MKELDDMKSEEICKVVGVTATNLWTMLHRARARLRKCIENKWFKTAAEGNG
jgi:RNA polymerase sigma-70 factor (ECF subfamily)